MIINRRTLKLKIEASFGKQSKRSTEEKIWEMAYRRRITISEGFEAYAASIITGFLYSSFHKGSGGREVAFDLRRLVHEAKARPEKNLAVREKKEHRACVPTMRQATPEKIGTRSNWIRHPKGGLKNKRAKIEFFGDGILPYSSPVSREMTNGIK